MLPKHERPQRQHNVSRACVGITSLTRGMWVCAAQILQRVPNNYETDLIYPIVAAAARLAGLDYHAASEREKISLKVRAALCRKP